MAERTARPRATATVEPASGPRWRAIAIVVAAVAALGVTAFIALPDPPPVERISAAVEEGRRAEVDALLTELADELTIDRATTENGVTATVVRDDEQALVLTTGLPALSDDRTYQVWQIAGRGPESVDVVGAGANPSVDIDQLRSGADAIAVSVEPAGGSIRPGERVVVVVPLRRRA